MEGESHLYHHLACHDNDRHDHDDDGGDCPHDDNDHRNEDEDRGEQKQK